MRWKPLTGAFLIFAAGVTLGAVGVIDADKAEYDRGYLEGSCNTYREFVKASLGVEPEPVNYPPQCPQAADA